jgi:hypothetical protein
MTSNAASFETVVNALGHDDPPFANAVRLLTRNEAFHPT